MEEQNKEEVKPDPEFQKGFNSGYLLAKFSKELSDSLAKGVENKNAFTAGLKAGREALFKERFQDRKNELQQINPDQDKNINPQPER